MDANTFLANLHQRNDAAGGVHELRVKSDEGPMIERKFSANPKHIEELVDAHKVKGKRTAVYYGVAKRYKGSKTGKKDDIHSVSALWADIDTVKMGWDTQATVAFLHSLPFPLRPSICVFSGGGLHLYWLLSDPIEFSPVGTDARREEIRRFEQVNKCVQQVMSSDMVFDVSRVLRLPGTWNTKARPIDTGGASNALKYAAKVEVVWCYWFAHDTLEDYLEAFTKVGDYEVSAPVPRRVLTPTGWGKPEDVRPARSSSGAVVDEKEAIAIAARVEKKDLPASWDEVWSRVRYHSNRWPYYGVDEGIMRATSMLWCKGGVTEVEVVDAVMRKLRLIHADQCPTEHWDWNAEEHKVRKQLASWVEKWTVIKRQLDAQAKAERAAKRAEAKLAAGSGEASKRAVQL